MRAGLRGSKDHLKQPSGPDDSPSQAFVDASSEYRPRPYPCRAILFKRTRGQSSRFALPDCGWGAFISGKFDVCMVPGDHYEMFVEPRVQIVADKLKSILAEVSEEMSTTDSAKIESTAAAR